MEVSRRTFKSAVNEVVTEVQHFLRQSRWGHRLDLIALSLISIPFFMALAGGRWAAYVAVPGTEVRLIETTFAVGVLASTALALLHGLPEAKYALLLIVPTLTAGILILNTPYKSSPEAIRDLSPELILVAVPGIASLFSRAGSTLYVGILRFGPLVLVGVLTLENAGLSMASTTQILHPPGTPPMNFPGREDVLGPITAAGILGWFYGTSQPLLRALSIGALFGYGVNAESSVAQMCTLAALGLGVLTTTRKRAISRKSLVAVLISSLFFTLALGTLHAGTAPDPQLNGQDTAPDPQLNGQDTAPDPQLNGQDTATDAAQINDSSIAGSSAVGALQGAVVSWRVRWETWSQVALKYQRITDFQLTLGAGIGHPTALLNACGINLPSYLENGGLNKCPVDNGSDIKPLRFSHNFLVDIFLYQGILGVTVFTGLLISIFIMSRPRKLDLVTLWPVTFYLAAGSFGVILVSPFGVVPVATMLGFMLSPRFAVGPKNSHRQNGID